MSRSTKSMCFRNFGFPSNHMACSRVGATYHIVTRYFYEGEQNLDQICSSRQDRYHTDCTSKRKGKAVSDLPCLETEIENDTCVAACCGKRNWPYQAMQIHPRDLRTHAENPRNRHVSPRKLSATRRCRMFTLETPAAAETLVLKVVETFSTLS